MWRNLNAPDNFDGSAVRAVEKLARRFERLGDQEGADLCRALASGLKALLSWYGELINQMGHTLLGIVATIALLCAWREFGGQMPYRTWTFAAVFLPYVIAIEYVVQRWKPGDAWFDSFMLACGAAGALLPFYEIGVDGHLTVVEFNHRTMAAIIVFWAVCLFLRVWKRYDANKRQV